MTPKPDPPEEITPDPDSPKILDSPTDSPLIQKWKKIIYGNDYSDGSSADEEESPHLPKRSPILDSPVIETPQSKWKKLIYGDDHNINASSFLHSPISAPPLFGNQGHHPTSTAEKMRRLIYGDEYVDDALMAERTASARKRYGRNEREKWERMIYGDKYFDENIAALAADWEDEDTGGTSAAMLQKLKNLVLEHQRTATIAIAVVFAVTAIV